MFILTLTPNISRSEIFGSDQSQTSLLVSVFYIRSPVASMCEAVVTVSPNRQYLGIVRPTTPATTAPEDREERHGFSHDFEKYKLVF